VKIQFRWADARTERLPELAADLAGRRMSAIITGGGPESALAAKVTTSTIPIVFAFDADPVSLGLVTSLSSPEGNITGATFITGQFIGKQLEVLSELVPDAGRKPISSSDHGQTIRQQTFSRRSARSAAS
jgi:putative tryptophan/tyrosine transport system substrate-binding protein